MNINFCGPINNTGYGIASFNILKELSKNNNIAYFPKGSPVVDNQEDYDLVKPWIENPKLYPHDVCLKIWHQFDLAEHIGNGKYYAFPFFELDTFSDHEKNHLKVPDSIFVTSDWAKQVMIDNGVTQPVDVIPLGVNTETFSYTKTNNKFSDKYIFLNIGKWEVRKGHDILLELFQTAFSDNNDVELWILASERTNSYSNENELNHWKKMYSSDTRVKISTGVETHAQIADIIGAASCGIFPSRAEGWNLELLECMAMNKPVIATNYSAHKEFCNKDNCYLIDIYDKELAFDGKAFRNQGYWAKIESKQKDQCIEHMRYLYKNNIRTNSSGLETAKKLSWSNTANLIERCIKS
jgi:glycosyltransferase involved in cell wall biosynthesis